MRAVAEGHGRRHACMYVLGATGPQSAGASSPDLGGWAHAACSDGKMLPILIVRESILAVRGAGKPFRSDGCVRGLGGGDDLTAILSPSSHMHVSSALCQSPLTEGFCGSSAMGAA